MSEENVEILREAYEGGSDQGFEILLSYATDDIVWTSDPRVPAGGTYVGKDAVRGNFAEMRSAFPDVVIEVDEIIDLGEGNPRNTQESWHCGLWRWQRASIRASI